MKTFKSSLHKINPYDVGALARITQSPVKNTFGSTRSWDINSAAGKNSSIAERPTEKPKK